MERALYEPGHGYYRRPDAGPGFGGDFVTAPELHPIFGAAIGRLLEQAWEAMDRPDPFTVTEAGAGTGALAAGLLGGLRDAGSPLLAAIRYRPVEREDARLAALEARLAAAGLAGHLAPAAAPRRDPSRVPWSRTRSSTPCRSIASSAGPTACASASWASRTTDSPGVEAEPGTPELAARLDAEGVDARRRPGHRGMPRRRRLARRA